jgi:hypothetical protein
MAIIHEGSGPMSGLREKIAGNKRRVSTPKKKSSARRVRKKLESLFSFACGVLWAGFPNAFEELRKARILCAIIYFYFALCDFPDPANDLAMLKPGNPFRNPKSLLFPVPFFVSLTPLMQPSKDGRM